MSLYDFYIKNNVPSLKNNKTIVTVPYPRLVSSSRVQNYMSDFKEQMEELGLNDEMIDVPICLTIKLYRDSMRRFDVDNSASTIMDSLMHSNFITDDSLVYDLHIKKCGVDKENPGARIIVDLWEEEK